MTEDYKKMIERYKKPEMVQISVDKFFKKLEKLGIPYTDADVDGIREAFQLGFLNDEIRAKYHIINRLLDMFKYDSVRKDKNYYQRLLDSNGISVTEKKCIAKYGEEEGLRRWAQYCNKQSVTNTFEYKNEKYGMTREEFDAYNKSRAVTLKNLIKRHGKERGQKIWDRYCERQAYAGCKLEYFIEKYGEERGALEYERIGKQKAHTIEAIMEKQGCSYLEAAEYRTRFLNSTSLGYSEISQDLFWRLYDWLPAEYREKCQFGELNEEYGFFSKTLLKNVFYDFICEPLGICIEFNGDYWHCNPTKYGPLHTVKRPEGMVEARSIWEKDKKKNSEIEDRGYELIVVWESDYRKNQDDVLERVKEVFTRKIQQREEGMVSL